MVRVWRPLAVLAGLCGYAVAHAQGAPGSEQGFDYALVDSLILERPYDRCDFHEIRSGSRDQIYLWHIRVHLLKRRPNFKHSARTALVNSNALQ